MNGNLKDLQSGSSESRVVEPPSRWKTRVLLPAVIAAVVVAILFFTSLETIMPATPVRVVPVVVKSVEGSAGTVTVQAPGWLEPDPHPTFVAALADGIVEDMLVLAGEPVEAGQVVAQLVDDDARLALQRADAVLAQRQSDLAAARAELTAANLDLEYLVERKRAVASAEALVAEAESEIIRVHADITVERAQLRELQDEYDRKSQLTDSKAVSEAAVARLLLRVEAQQATVDAAVARETDPDHVRVARVDRQAADRIAVLVVEDGLPGHAGVVCLPHPARARGDVPQVLVVRVDRDVGDATRHERRADAAQRHPLEVLLTPGRGVGVFLCVNERAGQGERGQQGRDRLHGTLLGCVEECLHEEGGGVTREEESTRARGALSVAPPLGEHGIQDVPQCAVRLDGVPQANVLVDLVVVATPLARAGDRPALLEVGDDRHHRALGDAHASGHIAQAGVGCLGQADQHVGVLLKKNQVAVVVVSMVALAGPGAVRAIPEDRFRIHDLQNMKSIS